jgi:hypothetical protein
MLWSRVRAQGVALRKEYKQKRANTQFMKPGFFMAQGIKDAVSVCTAGCSTTGPTNILKTLHAAIPTLKPGRG